ncbi:hypothetical protein [Falsiroseomonas tokyonensis]|uniref:Uncharacterized protein n=1 Tax=Falsiroseomonas tokyonensis TaxID=430521 RepID=A0ABV7C0Q6_9PROT|nr:hypothetical protein [Falsiroseomonas tokyonensis]MBU8540842.1 hypothetical protein [Falsiroseomonas tokyonensis]
MSSTTPAVETPSPPGYDTVTAGRADGTTPTIHRVPQQPLFRNLIQALGETALNASDRGDNAGFTRAMAYREAVRRLSERWDAGEPSPTRTAKKGDAALGGAA